jgi:stage III sporulation protein SpoIIIAA
VSATSDESRALPHSRSAIDDFYAMMECLPPAVRRSLEQQPDMQALLEVVLDLGRLPEARFAGREVYLGSLEVTEEDIQYVMGRVSPFGGDNRAGIERTLHRISGMRNRVGQVVGLTCRVGRAVFGTVRVVEDLILSGKNILLVGRPGVGKTTMLREIARVLADDAHKRVIIVDTSNEIAGDGDVPHPAIGRARRMQVPTPAQQHSVMIEAVENHMPEVIVIDEMGTEQESRAARTIAERGVQLIATAHGNTLENLLINPTLSDLVGGVQTVTLSDEEARRRRTQKAILERKAPPTFDALVEIQSWDRVAVHLDVAHTVDRLLRGQLVSPEVRSLGDSGQVSRSRSLSAPDDTNARVSGAAPASSSASTPAAGPTTTVSAVTSGTPVALVHPFGVSRDRLVQASREAGILVRVSDSLDDADLVLTTKVYYRKGSGVLRNAEKQGKPVFVLRRNTLAQLRIFLSQIAEQMGMAQQTEDAGLAGRDDALAYGTEAAAREARAGVSRVLNGQVASVELGPQSAYVRRVQHRIAEQANLRSRSSGREPRRRVTIRGG